MNRKTLAGIFRLIIVLILPVLLLNSAPAQEFLKMRVVNDFDIGDEFHFKTHREESGIWQAYHETDELENITITGKSFSVANDTVFYTQTYVHRIVCSGIIWDTIMIEQVFYTNLDRTTKDICGNYQGSNPNHSDPDIYRGRIRNSFSDGDFNGSRGTGYVEGLGNTNYYWNYSGQGTSTDYRRNLVYYKKGGEAWGTRNPDIPEVPNSKNSSICIYPNPASDKTTLVRKGTENAKLIISDCQGRKVHTEAFEGQIKTLSTGSLTPGIYYIAIVIENKAESAILVIQ
ncbi:MAG: T9SS type A sorting domain-containing protein [Bacteroidota bacterium]